MLKIFISEGEKGQQSDLVRRPPPLGVWEAERVREDEKEGCASLVEDGAGLTLPLAHGVPLISNMSVGSSSPGVEWGACLLSVDRVDGKEQHVRVLLVCMVRGKAGSEMSRETERV